LALTNNVALGGPTGTAAPVDTPAKPVEAKVLASSKKKKK
jgi:hypothetical protein